MTLSRSLNRRHAAKRPTWRELSEVRWRMLPTLGASRTDTALANDAATVDASGGPGARQPNLSVIIPAVNGVEILLECLEALRHCATSDLTLEILVVDRCGDSVRRTLAERAPEAAVFPVAVDTTIPQMRAIGIRHAKADAIAVIEDHVLVPTDWARQLLDALAAGADVVGGSVYNAATTTTVDWAAFLCEYSHLLSPVAGRSVERLTGNNVVYRRALVERYASLLDEGQWEDYFHSAMRRDGIALTCRPEIAVGHKMHYRMRDYITQRFVYSRALAGTKRVDLPFFQRVLFTIGSFALPPLLLTRISFRVLASNRHYLELTRSLPALVVFVGAWAAGEVVGYTAGPGNAMARVR